MCLWPDPAPVFIHGALPLMQMTASKTKTPEAKTSVGVPAAGIIN
jgi:hypothetical protein